MNARRLLGFIACALVVGCGLGSGASPVPDPSPVISPAGGGPPSVTGTVTAGPVCPVERIPPDPRCAPRPVAGAAVVATNADGLEVGRATSVADGSYQMIVGETGTLTISGLPVAGLMGVPTPVSVRLPFPSDVGYVNLTYDTGIR